MRSTIQDKLAPRQRQLVDLVADGCKNPEIADIMGITVGSTKAILSRMYKRLGLRGWGSPRGRLEQIVREQRVQYATNGYGFPLGM